MTRPVDLRLYAVLDPQLCGGRDPAELAAAAAQGGITLLQLRDKVSETRTLVEMARRVRDRLLPFSVPLVINDRVDIALASAADGVHVGQSDMMAADARRLLGPEAIVGATVHHAHEVEGLSAAIVDYFGLGPVFHTESKDPGDPPLGTAGLHRLMGQIRDQVGPIPVCGIAGINHRNARSVLEAGADGVAVISDIFSAPDVNGAARRLKRVIGDVLAGESVT